MGYPTKQIITRTNAHCDAEQPISLQNSTKNELRDPSFALEAGEIWQESLDSHTLTIARANTL